MTQPTEGSSPPSPAIQPAARERMPWVDHIRTFVIVLVVNMHSCVTYSHVGSWYWMSPHEPSLGQKTLFIVWQSMLQSFFMGLLFFFGGYFAWQSVGRRGPASFIRERLFRLGLPALLYMLVIHPFIVRVMDPWGAQFPPPLTYYRHFIADGSWLGASGPMWFALALLAFCAGLALWRLFSRPQHSAGRTAPGPLLLLAFSAALGLGSFAVRMFQPLGSSVFNMQLAYFTQYVAAFVAGTAASRSGWLSALAGSERARTAGWTALIAGPAVLLVLMVLGLPGGVQTFMGGLHWQAFGLAMWEQLTGVGLSLGLLAWFSGRLSREGPALRWLSARSFAVYVLHPPVIIGLAMAFRGLPDHPYLLAGLLTVTGLVASFLVADLALRVPGLRAILR